ncbi:MAG TPA: gliding motility-associated C-terminal domain-containing protein [Bacteroidia bacterium]|nr:gliding motility-associated C-terminal domain-containing protein [Bacteroidia bacterium]
MWNNISWRGGDDRNGIACSPDGECIYFGGDIADTITFGSDFLSDPGGETPFIARWEPCGRQIDTNENIITGTCTNIFVPDAFSPNKDGYNDVLYVRSDCIKTIDFILFDRWGEKIFETTSLNYGWDGTYKGQPMNTGSFVYYLKAQLYNGTSIEKKGSVALVR